MLGEGHMETEQLNQAHTAGSRTTCLGGLEHTLALRFTLT